MAAILPHLAEEGETTELEERYWECASQGAYGQSGLGAADDKFLCPSPQAVIDQSHASLLNVAMIRRIVVQQLRGRTITPGIKGKKVVLHVSEGIEGPAWNPMNPGIEKTSVLSWTTKMGAPSFSLPAGAKPMGGSCPGANAGQSIVPDSIRGKLAKRLLPVLRTGGAGPKQVNLAKSICEFCYAEGGQYATASVQFHQMVRYAWVQQALLIDMEGQSLKRNADGSVRTSPRPIEESQFVQVMIEAINNADFKLQGEPAHWKGQRFFRIHDSGDFFSLPYVEAWKAIADHFHPDNHDDPITFWAPTRMWATGPTYVDAVTKINGTNSNLVIRPSAYHIDEHGPELRGPSSGWAASSVVYRKSKKDKSLDKTFDWDCKAYAVEKGPSCRGAERPIDGSNEPSGKKGCRVCWKRPDLRVNYTLHGVAED